MNQLLNMIARAIGRRVSDTGSRQAVQLEVTKDELIDDVPRMQNYGFTSNPDAGGSDAMVLFPGGDREQGIIIVMENRAVRLTSLKTGEVAMYDDLGNVFKLGRDKVELIAVAEVDVTAPVVKVTAETLTATASASATIVSGDSTLVVAPGAVDITSALLRHNGKNIGATHYHVGSPATAVPV